MESIEEAFQFDIGQQIGQGGQASVYTGTTISGEKLALKLFKKEKYFFQEYDILADLNVRCPEIYGGTLQKFAHQLSPYGIAMPLHP